MQMRSVLPRRLLTTMAIGKCRLAFLLIALLDIVAVASSTVLYFRTRHIYTIEYAELHQHDGEVHESPCGGPNMRRVPSISRSGVADR